MQKRFNISSSSPTVFKFTQTYCLLENWRTVRADAACFFILMTTSFKNFYIIQKFNVINSTKMTFDKKIPEKENAVRI